MARDQAIVSCSPGAWTELTNADVTTITFQVISGSVKVRVTDGTTPSAVTDPGYVYTNSGSNGDQRPGELAVAITSLSTGAGADRVFAIPINGRTARVLVDHG